MTSTTFPIHSDGPASAYDVVVVGARAAGAATAMLLARQGLSVLAVDRAPYGSDTMSTHSLAGAGVLQLSRWGVLDSIRDAGTPVSNTVRFHYGDDVVSIDIPARGDVDGLYSPRRTVLDASLVDAAIEAGADVHHGVSMVSVITDPSGRAVGVELDVAGRRRVVCARFVVGADGARSRVARQVGARVIHRESVGATSMYAYFEGFDPHTIVNHYNDAHAVGSIPTNDGLAVVWVALPPATFHATARGRVPEAHAEQVALIPEFRERIAGRAPVGGYRSFPGTPGFLLDGFGPGWALVGDAGYFKDPVSAHGITDAFISAELAAMAIGDHLLRGDDEFEALSRFQAVRDELAAQMMPPVAVVAGFPGDIGAVKQGFQAMSAAMRDEMRVISEQFRSLAAV